MRFGSGVLHSATSSAAAEVERIGKSRAAFWAGKSWNPQCTHTEVESWQLIKATPPCCRQVLSTSCLHVVISASSAWSNHSEPQLVICWGPIFQVLASSCHREGWAGTWWGAGKFLPLRKRPLTGCICHGPHFFFGLGLCCGLVGFLFWFFCCCCCFGLALFFWGGGGFCLFGCFLGVVGWLSQVVKLNFICQQHSESNKETPVHSALSNFRAQWASSSTKNLQDNPIININSLFSTSFSSSFLQKRSDIHYPPAIHYQLPQGHFLLCQTGNHQEQRTAGTPKAPFWTLVDFTFRSLAWI